MKQEHMGCCKEKHVEIKIRFLFERVEHFELVEVLALRRCDNEPTLLLIAVAHTDGRVQGSTMIGSLLALQGFGLLVTKNSTH